MRINSIVIPEHITNEFGLSRIEMKGLDRIVIIAGKNGSGKTRLLNLIKNNEAIIQSKFSEEKRRILSNLEGTRKAYAQILRSIEEYQIKNVSELTNSERQDYNFIILKKKQFEEDILRAEKELKVEILKFEEGLPESDIYEFVPKRVDLKDPNELTKREIKEFITSEKSYKIDELPDITYGIIQALHDISVRVNKNYYRILKKVSLMIIN